MSYEVTSTEVAEDYKLALEDLTSNLRHEISNLTLIARENTEHAHAISDVLIEHIKRVGQILCLLCQSCRLLSAYAHSLHVPLPKS
jgi:hypothetical protein